MIYLKAESPALKTPGPSCDDRTHHWFLKQHLLLFLTAFYLGIGSAAPKLDGSLDAQWNQGKAVQMKPNSLNKEGWRRAVWKKTMKMIDLHNQEYHLGKHIFTLAINAFGNMTNEEFGQVINDFQYQKLKENSFPGASLC